jgi:xanthine dehydrogenase iron-sulfur cluster and FAD-binding subunit A
MTYDLVTYLRSEIKELHNILHETQLALAQANEKLNRQFTPLTDERIYTLYRRSLDWRQLARDIEADHDIE